MFCTRCGTEVPDGARFCPGCGASTEAPQAQTPREVTTNRPVEPAPQVEPRSKRRPHVAAVIAVAAALVAGVCFVILVLKPFSGSGTTASVSTGVYHTVGLKRDGTVVACGGQGDYEFGQCDVSGWKGITAVAAGGGHTVGLRKDGTVVACGFNGNSQCDVSDIGEANAWTPGT